jgi:hypothetical protein
LPNYKELCPFPSRNQWLQVLNDYMYDFGHKLLLWILCVKNHSHILMGHVINRWWGDNKMEGVNYHCLYFIYITSLTNAKVTWMSKCHYNDSKIITSNFDMNIDKPTPPPTYIPTYLTYHQPTYLPPTHPHMTHPPAYLSTYPPIYLPTHSPPTYLLTHHITTYILPTS